MSRAEMIVLMLDIASGWLDSKDIGTEADEMAKEIIRRYGIYKRHQCFEAASKRARVEVIQEFLDKTA